MSRRGTWVCRPVKQPKQLKMLCLVLVCSCNTDKYSFMSSAAISQHSSSLFITNLSSFLSPDPTLSCRLTSRLPLMSHHRGCLDWFKQVVCMHGATLNDTNVCLCGATPCWTPRVCVGYEAAVFFITLSHASVTTICFGVPVPLSSKVI